MLSSLSIGSPPLASWVRGGGRTRPPTARCRAAGGGRPRRRTRRSARGASSRSRRASRRPVDGRELFARRGLEVLAAGAARDFLQRLLVRRDRHRLHVAELARDFYRPVVRAERDRRDRIPSALARSAASAVVEPLVLAPSESSRTAAAGLPPEPVGSVAPREWALRGWRSRPRAPFRRRLAASRSPRAPRRGRRRRGEDGRTVENETSPMPNRLGTESTNAFAAALAAEMRSGATSVARIEPETSIASTTPAPSGVTASPAAARRRR